MHESAFASDLNPVTIKTTTKSHAITTICPRFSAHIPTRIEPQALEIHGKIRHSTKTKRKTHHNSPQNPKLHFLHTQMAQPPRLTFGLWKISPPRITALSNRQ